MSVLTGAAVNRLGAALNRLGLTRVNRTATRVLRRLSGDRLSVAIGGLTLSGPMAARRTLSQIAAGDYESFEVQLFEAAIQSGSIVVDVGAHVGYYALLAARRAGPSGHIYAFEPDPRTQQFVVENAKRNGIENVSVIPSAASDNAGERQMYLSPHANRSSLHDSATLDGLERVETVSTTTVDAVLAGRRADVVKIDAEGSEPAVLRGMARSLKPETVVFLEFNPPVLRSAGENPDDFRRWLIESFAAVAEIGRGELKALDALPSRFVNLRCTGWRRVPT